MFSKVFVLAVVVLAGNVHGGAISYISGGLSLGESYGGYGGYGLGLGGYGLGGLKLTRVEPLSIAPLTTTKLSYAAPTISYAAPTVSYAAPLASYAAPSYGK